MTLDRRSVLTSVAVSPLLKREPIASEVHHLVHGMWPPRERFAIWPGTPPGASDPLPTPKLKIGTFRGQRELWIQGIAVPEVSVFRPADPDGSAVLVCPGGAYSIVSVENAGIDLANVLIRRRITVFLLTYRLPGEGWASRELAPLSDAQRAMRLIRARARHFGIDPGKLGVFGSSAGGQLASDLAVSQGLQAYQPIDAADMLSARPAFVALLYPVTTLEDGRGHGGTRQNLLGPSPGLDLVAARSPLLHVAHGAPDCWLAHSFDDEAVPVTDSIAWMSRYQSVQASIEAYFFEKGRHGFGSYLPSSNPASRWADLLALWIQARSNP